ncbi:MAG TPA: hypothetical protein VFJ43_09830 [Bacteroidia bacterium]|nr:hypothetical protein [Bacteroidia bacterium]
MRPTQLFLLLSFLIATGCSKDNKPKIDLKTGAGYVSANCYGYPGGQFTVGLIADKTRNDLSSVYCEVAYDGAPSSHIVSTYDVNGNTSHYEKDFVNTLRNQSGTERWFFGAKDSKGKVNYIQINVTVP